MSLKSVLQIAAALAAGLGVAALQGVIQAAGAVVPQFVPDPLISALLIALIVRGAGFLVNLLGPKAPV